MNKKIKRVMSTAICLCMSGIDISSVATAHRYQNYNSVSYYDCNDSNKNEKSDSKMNWWWILVPLVPAILLGGRYLIKNHRANNNNSGNTSNLQNNFNDYEYEKKTNSQYNFDNYEHTEMSNHDNLDLKLEENDIKTLQTVNKLICSYDYWQAVVQKLNLNSSYCNQNFYDDIAKLCYNLCNPKELCKTFENLRLDDKKLIVSFLKDKNCTKKINQFISQLESDLKSRKEKFNSSNTRNYYDHRYSDRMYNKRETVNILNPVSSGDFIGLYNQTKFEDNPKNGRLLILPEVVKNQLCINNKLPDIDTALRSLSIHGVNKFSDIYNETHKTYDSNNLKAVSQKLKNIFHKYFADAECPMYGKDKSDDTKEIITGYKPVEEFIFMDETYSVEKENTWERYTRIEEQITNKAKRNINCYKFYVRFLYWFDKEAQRLNVNNNHYIKQMFKSDVNTEIKKHIKIKQQDTSEIIDPLKKSTSHFITETKDFTKINNADLRKFAELWDNIGRTFFNHDGVMCCAQLPANIGILEKYQSDYCAESNLTNKTNIEEPSKSSIFFDALRLKIKDDLKNICYEQYSIDKDVEYEVEDKSSYEKILSTLFNTESYGEIYYVARPNGNVKEFKSTLTINECARLMRNLVTSKFIRDILLKQQNLFKFKFKEKIASNFIETYKFKEDDLDILDSIYDGKLINEINDICNNANEESSPYDEEEKKFAKLFGELLSGKPVLSQLADCSYKFFDYEYNNITMDEYEALSKFLTDLSYVKNLNSTNIDVLFSLAYIFELKSQNYIDFVK